MSTHGENDKNVKKVGMYTLHEKYVESARIVCLHLAWEIQIQIKLPNIFLALFLHFFILSPFYRLFLEIYLENF